MKKEDKLVLGTLAGVDLILSPEHYEEYKGTLNKQLEEKDKEIERLQNIINIKNNYIIQLHNLIYKIDNPNLQFALHIEQEKYLKELKEEGNKE